LLGLRFRYGHAGVTGVVGADGVSEVGQAGVPWHGFTRGCNRRSAGRHGHGRDGGSERPSEARHRRLLLGASQELLQRVGRIRGERGNASQDRTHRVGRRKPARWVWKAAHTSQTAKVPETLERHSLRHPLLLHRQHLLLMGVLQQLLLHKKLLLNLLNQ
jgi:hypothetical protein